MHTSIHQLFKLLRYPIQEQLDDYFLNAVAQDHRARIIQCLQFHLVDIHTHDDYALYQSARQGNQELFHLLLQHGADVRAGDDSILLQAVANNHLPIVEHCLTLGANLHARNNHALFLSMQLDLLPMTQYLIQQGSNLFEGLFTARQYGIHNPTTTWALNYFLSQHEQHHLLGNIKSQPLTHSHQKKRL